jgi:Trypsin
MRIKKHILSLAVALVLVPAVAMPASAIVFGEPDGDDHPNVGAIVLDVPDQGLLEVCSGTLIDDQVFLTASHCTAALDFLVEEFDATMLVTFDPKINEDGTFFTGTWHTNPAFGFSGEGGASDPHDVGVIVLDQDPGITPASLPTAGLLNELKAAGTLKHTRFTAVGYGTIRESMRTGFEGILANVDRNRAEQGFNSLTAAWLTLPMTSTPGRDNGGTCYGDSGGPHFIHLDGVETDIVASITVTGDAVCKASDKTYRMDTESARSFLGQFVHLP